MEERSRKNGKGYGALDKNCNTKFARAIRKWGWDAFEGRVLINKKKEYFLLLKTI